MISTVGCQLEAFKLFPRGNTYFPAFEPQLCHPSRVSDILKTSLFIIRGYRFISKVSHLAQPFGIAKRTLSSSEISPIESTFVVDWPFWFSRHQDLIRSFWDHFCNWVKMVSSFHFGTVGFSKQNFCNPWQSDTSQALQSIPLHCWCSTPQQL